MQKPKNREEALDILQEMMDMGHDPRAILVNLFQNYFSSTDACEVCAWFEREGYLDFEEDE